MKQTVEFRVLEKHVAKLFRAEEGRRLGDSVRRIKLACDDPRFTQVCALNAALKRSNDMFFAGWDIERQYGAEELQRAELFRLHHLATFEPAGEECGTQYDEGSACPLCGSGARQTSPLYLSLRNIPKGKDICRTIANEILVSRRLADLLDENKVTGAQFKPIYFNTKSSATSSDWLQLVPTSSSINLIPPTVVGTNPCDEDTEGEYRCPRGDRIGVAILSEAWVDRATCSGADILFSKSFVGLRRGLLRPERLMFVSPNVRNLFTHWSIKGCKMDVAYLSTAALGGVGS